MISIFIASFQYDKLENLYLLLVTVCSCRLGVFNSEVLTKTTSNLKWNSSLVLTGQCRTRSDNKQFSESVPLVYAVTDAFICPRVWMIHPLHSGTWAGICSSAQWPASIQQYDTLIDNKHFWTTASPCTGLLPRQAEIKLWRWCSGRGGKGVCVCGRGGGAVILQAPWSCRDLYLFLVLFDLLLYLFWFNNCIQALALHNVMTAKAIRANILDFFLLMSWIEDEALAPEMEELIRGVCA